ncbi:MAG: recombination protein NinG [Moraxellaceae bacterium]
MANGIRAYRPRTKACRACATPFMATMPMQHACGIDCALALARAKREKAEAKQAKVERAVRRAEKKAGLAKLKTRAEYLKEAQAAFNAWIRERDHDLPCICCGSYGTGEDWLTGGKWDAGHFLSRGSHPELRFDPDNCHKQLKSCNAGSSKYARKGRTVAEGYRERLIAKIGLARVEWLEGPHEPRHYTIEELQAITAHYRAEQRKLAKARSQAVAA